ncbi:MAG: hypothetical protein H6581_24695 [Bacteroidia bacterium]|nr:hypothetical protein [Bacteroidia bacterium]
MIKKIFFLAFLFLSVSRMQATPLLDDLDLSSGRWVMIAVSLHNYHPMPIQEELGTFMIEDRYILKQIQNEWDFEEMYDDYCDFHYAVKFYKDGELMKTLRVNLLCNYIDMGGFSYSFTESDFMRHKRYFTPVKWSRIRFHDLDLLKVAVHKIDEIPNVYWYGDTRQYNFKGSFMIGRNHLPWNVNRDSVVQDITNELQAKYGRDDFMVETHVWYLSDDFEEMSMRFNVYCNDDFYNTYKADTVNYVMAHWRDHLSEQSFVQVVVIGMSKEDYFRTMKYY